MSLMNPHVGDRVSFDTQPSQVGTIWRMDPGGRLHVKRDDGTIFSGSMWQFSFASKVNTYGAFDLGTIEEAIGLPLRSGKTIPGLASRPRPVDPYNPLGAVGGGGAAPGTQVGISGLRGGGSTTTAIVKPSGNQFTASTITATGIVATTAAAGLIEIIDPLLMPGYTGAIQTTHVPMQTASDTSYSVPDSIDLSTRVNSHNYPALRSGADMQQQRLYIPVAMMAFKVHSIASSSQNDIMGIANGLNEEIVERLVAQHPSGDLVKDLVFDLDSSGRMHPQKGGRSTGAGLGTNPVNYAEMDLNELMGWYKWRKVSRATIAAIVKNERTPRYRGKPRPAGRRRRGG